MYSSRIDLSTNLWIIAIETNVRFLILIVCSEEKQYSGNSETLNSFNPKSNYLLVSPGSSSENIRYPLFISLVRGTNIFEVAFCGRAPAVPLVDVPPAATAPDVLAIPPFICDKDGEAANIFAVTDCVRIGVVASGGCCGLLI